MLKHNKLVCLYGLAFDSGRGICGVDFGWFLRLFSFATVIRCILCSKSLIWVHSLVWAASQSIPESRRDWVGAQWKANHNSQCQILAICSSDTTVSICMYIYMACTSNACHPVKYHRLHKSGKAICQKVGSSDTSAYQILQQACHHVLMHYQWYKSQYIKAVLQASQPNLGKQRLQSQYHQLIEFKNKYFTSSKTEKAENDSHSNTRSTQFLRQANTFTGINTNSRRQGQ